ncbi:MAG: amidophosphoribosyltransferase, partial [Clostridia bacterium]|nr:amidophosphoribosyltransferase [Clostridia bacterium]
MGGFFGAVSKRDVIADVFYGTDYHSHLGTRRGGMAAYDEKTGLQRDIHNIQNSPFRTKFEHIFEEMQGKSAIGCISDSDPQPLLFRSRLGKYAISATGLINNSEELIDKYLTDGGGHLSAMTGGKINAVELVAAIMNQFDTFEEGIRFVQDKIDGSVTILILKEGGSIIAARDKLGRLPVVIGRDEEGYCVSLESFACEKLGYEAVRELGPGEIVEISANGVEQLAKPGKEMRICSFLWSYYGYSTACYEGVNVETMRYRNGEIIAEHDMETGSAGDIDYVAGVPDSGTPHAIGYANRSHVPCA